MTVSQPATETQLRPHPRRNLLWRWIVIGIALGSITSLVNVFGSPYAPYSLAGEVGILPLEILGALLGSLWAWPVAAFAVGWSTTRPHHGLIAGVVVLIVATATYYLCDHLGGINDDFDVGSMMLYARLSLPAGAVMGLCGAFAAQATPWSIIPGMAAPAAIIMTGQGGLGSQKIQPWPDVLEIVITVVLVCLLIARFVVLLRTQRHVARST